MKVNVKSKAISLLVLLALLMGTMAPIVSAQTRVVSTTVTGSLDDTGSKHYLGLKVIDPTKSVKIVMDYRQDSSALDGGSGFYIFNEQGFDRFVRGTPAMEINLATGMLDSRSGLKQKIAIISDPIGTFSVVPYNDSNTGLDYTLTVENALIVDDSGEQVKNPQAAASETPVAAERGIAETVEVAPVVTVAASTTVSTTTTAIATATPVASTPATPVITRAESLQADLDEQYSKHYFDLAVSDTGSKVEVMLAYDPQDQRLLDNGFNFYVYSSDQFQQLIRSRFTPNQAPNTAAGTLIDKDGLKTLQASISTPFKIYTVIVGNDSTLPVSYTLSVGNGLLVDASGQSNTAQALMAAAGGITETTSTAAATGTTAREVTATTITTTTVTATTDPTVTPGGTYVVKSGETIATIARAAYGDVNLWDELCAFNSLENCDRIEVGQTVTVPLKAELGTGTVAAPVAAATLAPTPTPTSLASTEPVSTTAPAGSTTPATTAPVTTAPATTAPATTTASDTIIDVATNARQFEILLLALSLANLTDGLKANGPFTLFAPADAAFASLPEKTLDSLLADTAQLARVLQFHVVPQKLTVATITNGMTVDTLMGQKLTFSVVGGKITVNGAAVNATELPASNGSVFVIDSVLLPTQ